MKPYVSDDFNLPIVIAGEANFSFESLEELNDKESDKPHFFNALESQYDAQATKNHHAKVSISLIDTLEGKTLTEPSEFSEYEKISMNWVSLHNLSGKLFYEKVQLDDIEILLHKPERFMELETLRQQVVEKFTLREFK